jgi:cytoskeletal protein RodZ
MLCTAKVMNADLIAARQIPSPQSVVGAQQAPTTKIINKQTKLGSIIIGLLFVFGFGVLFVYFLYKGKKTKAKQRKNDQKYTLKQNNQNDKLSSKASKRTAKDAKAQKQPAGKGGNTINLKAGSQAAPK